MAMAVAFLAPTLAASLCSSVTAACSSASSAAPAQWRPACSPFSGHPNVINSGITSSVITKIPACVVVALRTVAINAAADGSETAIEEISAPAITTILSEAELIKKKAKRDELRRRRLVRKRKLRKKGKWPPSKMAKLKNV